MDEFLRLKLVTYLLQSEGALSYAFLTRQFDLGPDTLNEIRAELVELRGVARDEPGKGLVWVGAAGGSPAMAGPGDAARTAGPSGTAMSGPAMSGIAPAAETSAAAGTPPPGESGPAQSGAERRQLTVMFCDLVGSTALSTQMDPEDLRDVIAKFQDHCAEVIRRYDGFIARYMGDGMLVYFGYPRAHEDDAERATRAGLGIVGTMSALNAEIGPAKAVVLAVRVGVATGPVVVGDVVGEGAAAEAAVVGETPNLAARLQGVAKPNELVISDSTRQLIGERFLLEDTGTHELKGITGPVPAWRVIAESSGETGGEARPRSSAVPLVGRLEELGLLQRAWESSRAGQGQVVLVQGEPGVGKSRLLEAQREALAGEDYTWVSVRCSPYHTNSPLYPVVEQLKRAAGWQPDDDDERRLEKLEAALERQSLPLAEVVPLYCDLFSLELPEERYPPLDLNPKQRREATLDAIVTWLQDEAERRPVLQVWEDLHWADPTTLELIGLYVEQAPTTAMLHVLTYRPDFTPPWPAHSSTIPITLNRLGRSGVEAMVEHIAGGKRLPAEVLEHIVEKTDGVPLYVEEITKTILEARILEERGDRYVLDGDLTEMQIPSSLQDSLMARLDRVPMLREVAQLGSVLGREFAYRMLSALVKLADEELQTGLRRLVDDELLYQRGRGERARYIFKHALIQDAAYQSLLKRTRQRHHQQVGELLEREFPEIARAQPELVAHHYAQAQLPALAAPLWLTAGRHAIARSSNREAIAHLTQGIEMLGGLDPGRETASLELDFQLSLGAAHIAATGYSAAETEQAYVRAHQLLDEVPDDDRQFVALHGLCLMYWNRGRLHRNLEVAQEMLDRAVGKADALPKLAAHRVLAVSLNPMGRFEEALEHAERAVALYDPALHRDSAHLFGHDLGVGGYWHLAIARLFMGRTREAREAGARASAIAAELHNDNTTAYDRLWDAFTSILRGDAARAYELAKVMIEDASARSMQLWVVFGRHILGCALALQGEAAAAIDEIRSGRAEAERLSHAVLKPVTLFFEARALAALERLEEATECLDAARETARETGELWWMAEIEREAGGIEARRGGSVEAIEACYRSALETARSQRARLLELRAATDLARLLDGQGRVREARELLEPICAGCAGDAGSPDVRAADEALRSLVVPRAGEAGD